MACSPRREHSPGLPRSTKKRDVPVSLRILRVLHPSTPQTRGRRDEQNKHKKVEGYHVQLCCAPPAIRSVHSLFSPPHSRSTRLFDQVGTFASLFGKGSSVLSTLICSTATFSTTDCHTKCMYLGEARSIQLPQHQ